jgi:tRNA dimethylallyltransferase
MLVSQAVALSVVIAGPTAIGKTAVAVAMAAAVPGRFEIVSADSVQTYRKFDIGSAKPTAAERAAVPFHLVDVVDPDEDFTLVDYQEKASAAIADIVARGKTPLIVGGTGLYIRSIISGLGVPITGPDEGLRAQLSAVADAEGTSALHEQLKDVDPISAAKIHENDLKRIIRALEVFKLSGRPLSVWHQEDAAREKGQPLAYFALDRDRANLYALIDDRARKMFQEGIIEETAALRTEGYSPTLKPMTALGYLQANKALDGEVTVDEAAALTMAATHHYARRQLIWFRGEGQAVQTNVEGQSVEGVAGRLLERLDTLSKQQN